MANTRVTLGAVLGAIEQTASTVTNSLSALNSGIGMLNATVQLAATKQAQDHKVETGEYKRRRREELAKEIAIERLELKKFMSISTEHAELYEKAYTEIGEYFK